MVRKTQDPTLTTQTEQFFSLRHLERENAQALAVAMAEVGAQLIEIKEALAARRLPWGAWIDAQAARAKSEGLKPLSARTARDYMALARFRAAIGRRFPRFFDLEPSCLYPVLTLPDADLKKLDEEGVDGKPLESVGSRQMRKAASALRAARSPKKPKPAPTRAELLQKALAAVQALGSLSDAERRAVAGAVVDPAPPERRAIAAIDEACGQARMIANAARPVAAEVRITAKEAVERLALAVVLWPEVTPARAVPAA